MASLREASDCLARAIFDFAHDVPTDAAISGVERALSAVMKTSGRMVTEEVVDTIFQNFCVGK
jgi:tRNA modification GTPase